MPKTLLATLATILVSSVLAYGQRRPQFSNYRVTRAPDETGKIIAMDRGDLTQTAAQFRRRIRDAAKAGPNFAGHYAIVGWSCGMICMNLAVVNLRTSRIVHLPFEGIADGPCPENFYNGSRILADFRANSRLLILRGSTEEWGSDGVQDQPCATRYYVLRANRVALVRKILAH